MNSGNRTGLAAWRLFCLVCAPLLCLAALGATNEAAGAVHAAGTAGPEQIFRWRPFLAPFHSVLLHYPIGFVTMVVILEVYGLFRPGEELRKVIGMTLWISLGSSIGVAALGIMRANSAEYDPHTLSMHRIYGMAVPVFLLAALWGQGFASRAAKTWALVGYRGLLAVTLFVVAVAGHQGGNLTHGSQYLVQNAPAFLKTLMGENDQSQPAPSAGQDGQGVFATKIRPVLDAKCVICHSATKHKGGYRLDQPEYAMKGGDSGFAAIKPGDPLQSNLVRLILLPRDHEDVMPPDGKEPLTAEETMAVIQWIQAGALFDESAKATNAPTVISAPSTNKPAK